MENSTKSLDVRRKTLFVIGFLSPLHIQFLGKLYLVEILLLIITLNHYIKQRNLRVHTYFEIRKFIMLCGLSLIMGLIGSLVNGIQLSSIFKGIALLFFLVTDCLAIMILAKYEIRNMIAWYFGLSMSSLIKFFVAPDEYTRSSPWKFCFASAISTIFILFFPKKRIKYFLGFVLTALALINFYLLYRIEGAVLLSTILLLYLFRRIKKRKSNWFSLITVGLFLLIFIGSIYSYAGITGLLGTDLQTKSVSQSSGKYGTLLGGRNEIAFSSIAVREKPIFGWGFYAEPPDWLIDQGLQFLYEERVNTIYKKFSILQVNQIPAHSFLMQFVVFGGLLAGILWIYVLKFLGQTLLIVFKAKDYGNIEYLITYQSLITFWSILFSPFGAFERINIGSIIVLSSIYVCKRKDTGIEATTFNRDNII